MQPDASHTLFAGASNFHISGGNFGPYAPHNGYERLLQATAPNALHNSGHIPDPQRCHPGTRVAAINAIMNWIEGKNERTREKGICWVTGAAGAGKTSIGRSICERCEEEGKPLASFFFYFGDTTRNHSGTLVATLCSQICVATPRVRHSVVNVLENDPYILNKSLKIKFEALIIAPLREIYQNGSYTAPLLVIDGLDECANTASQREILETLLNILQTARVPIRFLICSRPEIQISNFFNTLNLTAHTFKIFLSDGYSPDRDIERFLRDRFRVIRELPIFRHLRIAGPWPSEAQIKTLIEKSSGQFIFAATVVKYVESMEHLPNERLEAVLNVQRSREDSPFAGLDALYRHLVMTTQNPLETINILTIPALYDDKTWIINIERILRLQPGRAQLVLSNLGSIVKVSDGDYVEFLHKSFVDFLFDRYRSGNLFVDKSETHARNILRIIEIFTAIPTCPVLQDAIIRFYHIYNGASASDILGSSSSMVIINALIEFPMQSLCETIIQNDELYDYEYFLDNDFLFWIFRIMMDLIPYHSNVEDAFDRHLHALCECNLSFLNGADNLKNWELNYHFAVARLETKATLDATLRRTVWYLEKDTFEFWDKGVKLMLEDTFQSLLTSKESRSRILARAAVFCLTFLCSNRETKPKVNRHLKVNPIVHTKQKSYPLLWKRRQPSYKSFSNRAVLLKRKSGKTIVSTYGKIMHEPGKLRGYNIYSLSRGRHSTKHESLRVVYATFPPFDWDRFSWNRQDWYNYVMHLKYFSCILSDAGPYDPLIEMCKTLAFAKMSMMFPKDSRRARRAITIYLERVGAKDYRKIRTN